MLDATKEGHPLVYMHGVGQLIPGLERALDGRSKGDKVDPVVKPEDGYGNRNDALVKTVSKKEFDDSSTLELGMRVRVSNSKGAGDAWIVKLDGDDVTLDLNHPLAGETLHFDVTIVDIREATPDEISHGHVHGTGGVHH